MQRINLVASCFVISIIFIEMANIWSTHTSFHNAVINNNDEMMMSRLKRLLPLVNI